MGPCCVSSEVGFEPILRYLPTSAFREKASASDMLVVTLLLETEIEGEEPNLT